MSALKSIFSSDSPTDALKDFKPTGFTGGGFNTVYGPGGLSVTPTAERLGAVGGLSKSFGDLSTEIAGLRPKVAPGMSDLRTARLNEIENARTSAIGNLRENLARRRVLGSSFGADALTRAENEFAQQKDKVQAETFLQEMEATNNLIQQQFAAQRGQFQTGLDELNLEADIASKLSANATNVMAKNAQTLAELKAKEQSGLGSLLGSVGGMLLGDAGKNIGKKVGSFFE